MGCYNLMLFLGTRRLDLIPYPGSQFNKPYMSDMIPYFNVLKDLRLEDNVFIFDDQAQQFPDVELSPHAILPKLPNDMRVRRAS